MLSFCKIFKLIYYNLITFYKVLFVNFKKVLAPMYASKLILICRQFIISEHKISNLMYEASSKIIKSITRAKQAIAPI